MLVLIKRLEYLNGQVPEFSFATVLTVVRGSQNCHERTVSIGQLQVGLCSDKVIGEAEYNVLCAGTPNVKISP